jgi:hypothetical protein
MWASAQSTPIWEAFNDYSPGGLTAPNATGYKLRVPGEGGILKNYATAEDLLVMVMVENEGGTPDDFGARGGAPAAGSPSMQLFGGKVDLSNDGLPGVHETIKLTLVFTGLDPGKLYKFCGTVSRGGNYNNRWSVFTITGVGNFVAAHMDGSANRNIFTAATYAPAAAALGPNQVAVNTGHNLQGSVVCWDKIEPAADGSMRIEALRYLGPTPFGNAADPGTSYAYGFEAMYLAEFESTGDLRITENPLSQKVPAGRTAALMIAATSLDPITYQWQKAPPGSDTFTDIPGANQATYTTPVLMVSDNGSKYRCVARSFALEAISDAATITVDGTIPTIASIRGSVNFNSVYVTFSEPMNLEQLIDAAHYGLSGGVMVNSAVGLDPTTVRLLTDQQAQGTQYTLTVNGVEDLAGNPVAANSTAKFTSYTLVGGAVGAELWDNITGGAVNDLRSNARYPLDYNVDFSIATFDSFVLRPGTDYNTYGGRMRAYVVPQETADYVFFIRGDDSAELRLGGENGTFQDLDDDAITTPILTGAAGPFLEPGSAPVSLEAGKKYPMQAIWKEGNGADYCQVAWRKSDDPTPADLLQPIPTQFLQYYGLPRIIRISLNEIGEAVIEFTGSGLESTADFNTWTEVTGATSPYTIDASGTRFYRSKN